MKRTAEDHPRLEHASGPAKPALAGWPDAVASSPEVIIGLDLQGRVTMWSTGAESFYGYPADEIRMAHIAKLRPAFESAELTDTLDRLRAGREVAAYEAKHRRKDGVLIDVMISPWAVRDERGEVIGSCAIIRDVQDAKRAQSALEEANESRTQLLERLTELERVKATFVSSVSHELRTPLTSILGYLELLLDDPSVNEGQREMLDIVGRNSHRLLSLIEDILVFSNVESDAFTTLKEPVDVRSLIAETCRSHTKSAASAGHSMEVVIHPEVGSVLGDADELERAIENLLTNAIKFTPSGGHIRATAKPSAGGVEIAVSDDGIGLDPAEQVEMFTPFFRAAEAMRRAIPGTGLGLSIVQTVIEKHGGTITCKSVPGEGTTMTIVLPYAMATRIAS